VAVAAKAISAADDSDDDLEPYLDKVVSNEIV